MDEEVILVDPDDQQIGVMNKMEAHQKGVLHRAFSIFIFNHKKEFLLQKRSSEKYHSPNLWTNTCCSHPRPEESTLDAAGRRLKEEMGMKVPLTSLYSFIYKVNFQNGLSEHELDHIMAGFTDEAPVLNPEEASEWKYMSFEALQQDIDTHPEAYTEWFKLAFAKTFSIIQNL